MDDDGNYQRLRDDNRKQYERKKRKSDTGEQMASGKRRENVKETQLISIIIWIYLILCEINRGKSGNLQQNGQNEIVFS